MHLATHAETGREPQSARVRLDSRYLILGAGLLMVAVHLVHRGWIAFQGYFFADDYGLLFQGQRTDLGSHYLLAANGHLTPAGRFLIWVVAHSGVLNWRLAASISLTLDLLTCLAALSMCLTLFGWRWAALAPLALYLSTALTLPAFTWWISSLLLVPTQLAFFVGVTAWVRYLRGDGLRWALAALGGVAFALLFDVKGLVVLPVLAYLALAYFAEGSVCERVSVVLRRYWPAAAIGLPPLALYLWYFVSGGDQPTVAPTRALTGELVDTAVGDALPPALLGGPWRWESGIQPTSLADAPSWSVHASWVVLAAVVGYAWLRREKTLRAWGVLLLVLVIDLGLLLVTRAAPFGATVGREYRFLAEVAPAAALAVGLAFLRLLGAQQSSSERALLLLALRAGRRVGLGVVAVVSVLGLVSQTLYARHWHSANASEAYAKTLRSELRIHGRVDLMNWGVPEAVVQALSAPYNSVKMMASLVSDNASFPDATDRLIVVGDDGTLQRALIPEPLTGATGPVADCGWLLRSREVDIPLDGSTYDAVWWVHLSYLASAPTTVTVAAGDSVVDGPVDQGLGELWVRVDGTVDSVRLSALASGATMCVDRVEVGQPEAGGYV
jgi:hypothetical protein